MAQRHICPSMGAMRRSFTADLALLPRLSSRTFARSARRLEQQGPVDALSVLGYDEDQPDPNSRRARSATALKQITSLQNQRDQTKTPTVRPSTDGQARRDPYTDGQTRRDPYTDGQTRRDPYTDGRARRDPFTDGQARRDPFTDGQARRDPYTDGQARRDPFTDGQARRDLFTDGQARRDLYTDGQTRRDPFTDGQARRDPQATQPRLVKFTGRLPPRPRSGAPPGPMVRGPATTKITPNAPVRRARGPNLSARKGPPRSGARQRSDGGEGEPKRRSSKAKSSGPRPDAATDVATASLTDGMVHHLLRLQRNEWDRVPYEPKYAPGSLAAQKLIFEGRELFRGEAPPVKIWGPLEHRIGIVGMFGAEAHLKMIREPTDEAAPFEQEGPGHDIDEAQKESTTQ